MSEHEPISLREARKRIGYRRGWRSLLNALTARELSQGVRFVDRHPGPRRTRYRVTVAAIRTHAPDLVRGDGTNLGTTRSVSVEVRQFREALQELDERAADIAADQIVKRVRPECLCNPAGHPNRRKS